MRPFLIHLFHCAKRTRKRVRLVWLVAKRTFSYLSLKDTRKWFFAEAIRRAWLRHTRNYCGTLLFTYPRSGNHAVRAVIEFVTNRSTLGAGDTEKLIFPRHLVDRPIFLRSKFASPPLFSQPAAVKRHEFASQEGWDRLIIVVRNPMDAIVSHTRELTDDEFEKQLEEEVSYWLEPVYCWQSWDSDARLLIQYADLNANPARILAQIATFFGEKNDPSVDVASIFEAAIESLQRPPTSHLQPPSELYPSRALLVGDCLTKLAPEFDWKKLP